MWMLLFVSIQKEWESVRWFETIYKGYEQVMGAMAEPIWWELASFDPIVAECSFALKQGLSFSRDSVI